MKNILVAFGIVAVTGGVLASSPAPLAAEEAGGCVCVGGGEGLA